jgi:Sulfotransferase domain
MTDGGEPTPPPSRSPIALPTDWDERARPVGFWDAPVTLPQRARQRVRNALYRVLPDQAYGVARAAYRGAQRVVRRNLGRQRLLPDFLIIGVAKGGTTSLCAYLNEHPFVAPAARKEVHFFDYQYSLGEHWYRGNFPSERERDAFAREHGRPFLTGEASPSYISHRWAPERIARMLPDAKLLVALRDPVDRAYSHFQMSRREDKEPIESFEEAVLAEEERLRPELARAEADPTAYVGRLGAWSYLLRSRYAEQLERWFELFPREQFQFVKSEALAKEPAETLAVVYEFLGLPPHERGAYPSFHVADYDDMPPSTRRMLEEYFRPHNERLYELVGTDFGWEAERRASPSRA